MDAPTWATPGDETGVDDALEHILSTGTLGELDELLATATGAEGGALGDWGCRVARLAVMRQRCLRRRWRCAA